MSPSAGMGADGESRVELTRLRAQCRSHELALDKLVQAVVTLRRGADALRSENRELRLELERARRGMSPAR